MVSFASTMTTPHGSTIKAIFFNEISERPSSYFFHLSHKLRQDVPFFKDKAKKGDLHAVKKAGERHGITVKTKVINSIHLSEDVSQTAQNYICDMILVGVNHQADEPINMITPGGLKKSVSDFIDIGIDQFVGSGSPTGRVVKALVKDVEVQLGIFVCKIASGTTVQKVAFLYNGLDHERASFDTVLKMHHNIKVDLFAPDHGSSHDFLDFNRDVHENINVILSDEPSHALLEALRGSLYDLVVVASARGGATPAVVEVVKDAAVNVLVIFPPVHQNSTEDKEKEKASIA